MRERVAQALESVLRDREARLVEAEVAFRESEQQYNRRKAIVEALRADVADIKADLGRPA